MHQNNQSNQSIISRIKKEKSEKCLICLEDIYQNMDITFLFSMSNKICINCLNKIKILNKHNIFNGYKMWVLYEYDDFMKNLIYQYKGCYDISLAPVFLHIFRYQIKFKYNNYCIVYPPSSLSDDKKRGFNHIKEMVKYLKMPIVDLFCKDEGYKQSEQNFSSRNLIKNHIKIKDNILLEKLKILIIDDIITSGNTILTLINLLKENYPYIQDIKILIISQSMRKMSAFVERK